jgi:hypothetical protein
MHEGFNLSFIIILLDHSHVPTFNRAVETDTNEMTEILILYVST